MKASRKFRFFGDDRAVSTVEFVVIFPFFLLLVLFSVEIALALFWWQSVQEAAQLGARMAIVTDPAVVMAGQPGICSSPDGGFTNCKTSAGVFGGRCSAGNCVGYAALSCTGGTGGSCDATAFTNIYNRMHALFPAIPSSDVTITYADSGLGFAGGPIIPMVTVAIQGVPFSTGLVPILGNLFTPNAAEIVTVPTMTATLTGEILNSSGAGG